LTAVQATDVLTQRIAIPVAEVQPYVTLSISTQEP